MRADFDRAVLHRIAPVLSAAGIPAAGVDCHNERRGFDMVVHLTVPGEVDPAIRRALSVRVLDAVTAGQERFGTVEVLIDRPGDGP